MNIVVSIERTDKLLDDTTETRNSASSQRRNSQDYIIFNRGAQLCRTTPLTNQSTSECSITPDATTENNCIQFHLAQIVSLLRPQDKLQTAVMLQPRLNSLPNRRPHYRYLCIICCEADPGPSSNNNNDPSKKTDDQEEHHALLGVDIVECSSALTQDADAHADLASVKPLQTPPPRSTSDPLASQSSTDKDLELDDEKDSGNSMFTVCDKDEVSVGMLLPICMDLQANLDGDGGLQIISRDQELHVKPANIPALWNVKQQLEKALQHAIRRHISTATTGSGTSVGWLAHYSSLLDKSRAAHLPRVLEWSRLDDVETRREDMLPNLSENPTENEAMKVKLAEVLRQIMFSEEDLDSLAPKQLRAACESRLNTSLGEYRDFIMQEIMVIYGQMERASRIFDHLYLGSVYNAMDFDTLHEFRVTHILNVTREVDNFYPDRDRFHYKNVRILDEESSQLWRAWPETHTFINQAKKNGTCCLVHCQRGVSRSASTVIAYAMKEYNWSLEKALRHVKQCRPCVKPNDGFMEQLKTYEGILKASQQNRYCSKLQHRESDPTPLRKVADMRSGKLCYHMIKSAIPNDNTANSSTLQEKDEDDLHEGDAEGGVCVKEKLREMESGPDASGKEQEQDGGKKTFVHRCNTMPLDKKPVDKVELHISPPLTEEKSLEDLTMEPATESLTSSIRPGTVSEKLKELERLRDQQQQQTKPVNDFLVAESDTSETPFRRVGSVKVMREAHEQMMKKVADCNAPITVRTQNLIDSPVSPFLSSLTISTGRARTLSGNCIVNEADMESGSMDGQDNSLSPLSPVIQGNVVWDLEDISSNLSSQPPGDLAPEVHIQLTPADDL